MKSNIRVLKASKAAESRIDLVSFTYYIKIILKFSKILQKLFFKIFLDKASLLINL